MTSETPLANALEEVFSKEAFQPAGPPQGGPPPGAMPPGAMPPGAMPPGAMPPGAMPPGAMPPQGGGLPPEFQESIMTLFDSVEQLVPVLEDMKGKLNESEQKNLVLQQSQMEQEARIKMLEKALSQPVGVR